MKAAGFLNWLQNKINYYLCNVTTQQMNQDYSHITPKTDTVAISVFATDSVIQFAKYSETLKNAGDSLCMI